MVRFIICGRFTRHTPAPQVRKSLRLDTRGSGSSGSLLQPRYNIAPSQNIAIVRETAAGRELAMSKWGWFRLVKDATDQIPDNQCPHLI